MKKHKEKKIIMKETKRLLLVVSVFIFCSLLAERSVTIDMHLNNGTSVVVTVV